MLGIAADPTVIASACGSGPPGTSSCIKLNAAPGTPRLRTSPATPAPAPSARKGREPHVEALPVSLPVEAVASCHWQCLRLGRLDPQAPSESGCAAGDTTTATGRYRTSCQ